MECAGSDFGGLVEAMPARVVRPGSVHEVVETVKARRGLPVAARGCGHSTYGQALAPGGIVLEMRGLAGILEVRPGSAVVEAGATWREVLDATLPQGLTPPVLTDYLDLTVGGTISAGGMGGTSFRCGTQADNVSALEVVTGSGELVRCSATRHRELFDGVRAGLGTCGVIVTATVDLVRAPAQVRTFKVPYATARELVDAQRFLAAMRTADDIAGQAKLGGVWRYELAATVYDQDTPPLGLAPAALAEERTFLEFADRMRPEVEQLIDLGEWARPHPWAVLFLPGTATADLVTRALATLGRAEIGISGVVLINPVGPTRVPLLPLPPEPFHFGLLRTASPGGAATETSIRANRELYELVRAAGGTRYAIDSVPFGPEDWPRHYGPAWQALRAAQNRYGTGSARDA